MVQTIKFSQMTDGGDLLPGQKTPSLLSGNNVLSNNPNTFLASGTTSQRPPVDPVMYNRLRFNTSLESWEYYAPAPTNDWVQLQDSLDIQDFPFVIYRNEPLLPNSFNLGTLTSGILKQTVTTGVSTPQIALNGTDYYGPGFTGYLVSPSGIADAFGNPIISLFTSGINSVNHITFSSSTTNLPVLIQPEGTDSNIELDLFSKGLSSVKFGTLLSSNACIFLTGTNHQHVTTFNFFDTPTARNVTFQDASGTLAYLSDIPSAMVSSITGTVNQVLANGTTGTPQTGDVTLTLPQDIGTASTPLFSDISLANGQIFNSSGHILLNLPTVASTVNYISLISGIASGNVRIQADGTDTNIGIVLVNKGNGPFGIDSDSTTPITFSSGTGRVHSASFSFANTSNTQIVTFQDFSGTVAYLTDIPSVVPSALTRTNDTNVTLTLGGTPATSLLQSVSLNMGWTGQLSLSRGGTNASLTASNGGIVYSNASSFAILSGTPTSNLPLLSGSSSSPSWGAFPLSLGGSLSTAGSFTLSGAFASTFTFTNTTSVTFPTSGTLATTSQLPTPSALTEVNDTNVTLTLGGTPATALLQPVSLTMGWTGQLSLARGGTNASLTASNGGVVSSTATGLSIVNGTATAGQMFQSGSNVPGSWTTNTWPSTSAINSILFASAANTIGNIAPGNSAIMRTNSAGVPGFSASMTNGQLMIGSTGGTPAPATLTVNAPLSIVNGSNSISLSTVSFSSVNMQIFSSSGTYTPTAGMKYCEVYLYGGCGAGGGTPTASIVTAAAGGGGGSGALSYGNFSAASVGVSQAITIGAGGTGVSDGNGNNGGSSSFGALMTAPGGAGGPVSGAASASGVVLGGAGASAGTGGSILSPGNPGTPGTWNGTYALSGRGAVLNYGGGTQSVRALSSSGAGTASTFFGGGSGSAIHGITGANLAGGNGTAGGCFILEYI